MKTESQESQILSSLMRGHSITPLEALFRYDCLRLGARIANLRGQGWPIETEIVQQGRKRFAKYTLKKKD